MIVYFSTVIREAPFESGGQLIKLDWRRKDVLAKVPIIPCAPMIPDPNPRGGTRGGRGILVDGKEIYCACYHSVYVLDEELRPLRTISNYQFADLHELTWEEENIWATSTVLDGLIKVDRNGQTLTTWWPRDDPVVAGHLRLPPLELDRCKDNRLAYLGTSFKQKGHTHLNAVTMLNGRPVVLLNKFGCLVQLGPTRILVEDPQLRGAHNVVATADQHLLVNDTLNPGLLVYDCEGKFRRRISLGQYRPVRKIRWRFAVRMARLWLGKHSPSFRLGQMIVRDIAATRPLFMRGLCETKHGTVLIGTSPATILEIDWITGKLVDYYSHSRDVHEAIHGLTGVCS